jgi:allantoinase
MKRLDEGRFDLAWGGIASLSVALPVVWTQAQRRGFPVEDLVRWMSVGPAKLAGMSQRAGKIAVGREANFVVFDPDAEFDVTPERLHFRHAISPYVGTQLRGVVEATYLRGEPVWSAAGFDSRVRGRELTLC